MRGLAADAGPPGTLGVPLTPGRSLAVDAASVPLGAPVWLVTRDPLDGTPIRRLVLAQDTGRAIRGPAPRRPVLGLGRRGRGKRRADAGGGGELVLLLPRASKAAEGKYSLPGAASSRTAARRYHSRHVGPDPLPAFSAAPAHLDCRHAPDPAARRALRHLPRRPLPAECRLLGDQAAGGCRLPGRGAGGPDLLRPAGLQHRRPRHRAGPGPRRGRCLPALRLHRGAARLLRRQISHHYPGLFADDPHYRGKSEALAAQDLRAGRLPDRRARRDESVDARIRRRRHLPRQLLRPARARHQGAAAQAARPGCPASR